jgi:ABC-type nitrate/sulfonate/bicarbonate transport system substrate-binding protein
MVKRWAPALLAAGVAAWAGALPSAAAELLRVGKSTTTSFSYTLVDVGVESGIFRKHGLELELAGFTGGQRLMQGLAAGSLDIALDTGPDMALVLKGAPVKAVSALADRPIELVLTTRPDSPIKTIADLKGRKVGVSSRTALTGWLTAELSRRQGWGPDGINLVAHGAAASRALMRAGEVDAVATDLGSVLEAVRLGQERLLYSFGDMLTDFHMQVFFATDTLIQERPQVLRAFLSAWFETLDFARKNKDETLDIEQKVLGFDRGVLSQIYDRLIGNYSSTGRFNPAGLDILAQSYVEMGLVEKKPDMSRLYTEAFLPQR